MTLREARLFGKKLLEDVEGKKKSSTPALDADVLLCHKLNCDKTFLLFHGDQMLSEENELWFKDSLQKRSTGFPVAYITGHKEFFGYDFQVTPDTLIPKPDTETLVELAIEEIKKRVEEKPDQPITICDMCTGTGCVGISIVKYCTENHVTKKNLPPSLTMCDISAKSLDLARENARKLLGPLSTVSYRFVQTNLFEKAGGRFNLIVANPPYVPAKVTMELLKDGRAEPVLALNGDVEKDGSPSSSTDGLSLIRRLIPDSYKHLEKNGMLLVESGEYNAEETARILEENGFSEVKLHQDLSGMLRVTTGKRL